MGKGKLIYGKMPNGYDNSDDFGYGSSSGYSSGYGYGYGYGSGYGNGDGSGYGDGDGYGSGSGDGYGYGYSYGYSDGSKEAIRTFLAMVPKIQGARARKLVREGAKLAYWRSNKDGKPANGGQAEPVAIGTVQETAGPLNLCRARHVAHDVQSLKDGKGSESG